MRFTSCWRNYASSGTVVHRSLTHLLNNCTSSKSSLLVVQRMYCHSLTPKSPKQGSKKTKRGSWRKYQHKSPNNGPKWQRPHNPAPASRKSNCINGNQMDVGIDPQVSPNQRNQLLRHVPTISKACSPIFLKRTHTWSWTENAIKPTEINVKEAKTTPWYPKNHSGLPEWLQDFSNI